MRETVWVVVHDFFEISSMELLNQLGVMHPPELRRFSFLDSSSRGECLKRILKLDY